MSTRAPAIEVDGLVVRRGRTTVLDGLGFTVESGDVVGLLDPSGCGKSNLLRSIVGTQLVHGGSVRILGEPAGSRLSWMSWKPSGTGCRSPTPWTP